MSVNLSGAITAIATAALAAFAIVTAWYARRAFLKQSQEVRAIEQQVMDQEEVTRQQASKAAALGIVSWAEGPGGG
jgi:hypothetical protein